MKKNYIYGLITVLIWSTLAAIVKSLLFNIPDLEALNALLEPWYVDRNKKQRGVDWQFTTDDARVKLKRLYPIINI